MIKYNYVTYNLGGFPETWLHDSSFTPSFGVEEDQRSPGKYKCTAKDLVDRGELSQRLFKEGEKARPKSKEKIALHYIPLWDIIPFVRRNDYGKR